MNEQKLMTEIMKALPREAQQMMALIGQEALIAMTALKSGGEIVLTKEDAELYAKLMGGDALIYAITTGEPLIERGEAPDGGIVVRAKLPKMETIQ